MAQLPRPARPIPGLTKVGGATILFGFVFDLSEHSFAPVGAGFTPGEHAAHLVVLIGMVLGLAGIVADGLRHHPGRADRPERSPRNAVR